MLLHALPNLKLVKIDFVLNYVFELVYTNSNNLFKDVLFKDVLFKDVLYIFKQLTCNNM